MKLRSFVLLASMLTLINMSWCCDIDGQTQTRQKQNTVIVMGMIHGKHRESEVYDLERVKSLIRKINPDFVLTEIPPDRLEAAATQFREAGKIVEPRVKVFPEYTDALFPLTTDMDFQIIPCAAWTREMNESRRQVMAQLEKSHVNEWAEMEQAQSKADSNIREMGDRNDPAVIHTEEYDQFVRDGMEPYDRHFNDLIGAGGWENINASHYALIEKALNRYQGEGKRFLITFGSWHKYYIKEQLRKRSDVRLVSLTEFLEEAKDDQTMNWTQFRFSSDRCGAKGATEIREPVVAWKYPTGEIIESSPAVCDGLAFIGGHSKRLHAIDIASGQLRWQFETQGWVRASPSIADGLVYFGSDDNRFYAVDAKTGDKKWEFELGDGGQQSSPAIADGIVYFGAFDNYVYALDADTGTQQWKFDAGASMLSSPGLDAGAVFIGTYDGALFAIDRTSGKQRWKFQQNEKPVFSSPAVIQGVVYFTSYDHHVYALDSETGQMLWKYETGGEIFSSPAVVDGVVYVGSNDNHLYALNSTTGKVIWRTDLYGAVFSSPAVTEESIYVGSSDGHLYAVNRETGEKLWRYLVGEGVKVWTSPAAVDGRLYFGSHAGDVMVLKEKQ